MGDAVSAAAIRLRERLLALRDEQDTVSPEFARLDRVATRLESARLAWVESGSPEAKREMVAETWIASAEVQKIEARCARH